MFKKNFTEICAQKGLAPSMVCKSIGLSGSVYSEWSDDTVPRKTTLIKLADYLGVSVDYLLGKEEAGESEEMKKIHELIGQLTEEEVQEAINYILFKRAQKNNRP